MTRQELKDSVYSNMAKEISRLSRDENTHIGAIIIAKDGTLISAGYNGAIAAVDDSLIPYSREEKSLLLNYVKINKDYRSHTSVKKYIMSNKYPFMAHAESNAIYFSDKTKLEGATIYVTGFPCIGCALQIARAKFKRVVVVPTEIDKNSSIKNNENNDISMFYLLNAGVIIDMDGFNYINNKMFCG